jgi:hypothetical protein
LEVEEVTIEVLITCAPLATNAVYTDLRGQYVLDDKGQLVYGVWTQTDEYTSWLCSN